MIKELFSTLGFCSKLTSLGFMVLSDTLGVVECATEDQFIAAMKPSCLMGDYYTRCKVMKDWLVSKGFAEADATEYIAHIMDTILDDALRRCAETPTVFEHLIKEQTPGGLNEKVIKQLTEKGAYDILKDTMDNL